MYAGRNRRLGFLYVLPALLFVLVFTAYPFVQMVWMSFHSWSLIKPPKFIGLNNFSRLFADEQFWVSLGFTLKYTILITPILMVGGYLLALLTARNTPLRRFTRADGVHPRGHRPGRVEPALATGCSTPTSGPSTRRSWTWASSTSPSSGWARTPTARRGRSSSRCPGRSSASA